MQLIPSTSKYTYNFYNFIKNIFRVIYLLITLFTIKKKNYEKKKKQDRA